MNNLRQFLDLLRREREIVEIDVSVSSDQELAEIHRRVVASGGPALLFKNVENADFPCVTNLFGSTKRVDMAFGSRPERFIKQVADIAQELPSVSPQKVFWRNKNIIPELLRVGMKNVSQGPVTEIMQSQPDLTRIPMLKTWPEDGGHFVTLPLVYTEDPDTGHHNLGMYRMQRHSARTMGVHWQIQKGGGFHHYSAEKRNQSLPLALFVGGPPALILSAIAPLPEGLPELMLASLLQGERLRRVRHPDVSLPLIAEAEFAICGEVPALIRQPEGPFGDHYGYYSLRHDYPILNVSRIFHRKDAIFPATVVGKPPQEDLYLGGYIQELMAPLSKLIMPAIRAIWSYGETGYHSLTAIAVEERYPREAMKFAFQILGQDGGQLNLTKFLLVIDAPFSLGDFRKVLEYALERTQLQTDLFIIANLAMDSLDYTGPEINKGSKGILIGVGDPVRELPRKYEGELPTGAISVGIFCGGCLAVQGPSYRENDSYAERLARDPKLEGWLIVFLVDDVSIVEKNITFLWSTFTRFEPAGDVYSKETSLRRHHLCYDPPIVLDCRMKPGYPAEVVVDEAIMKQVTTRWEKYFPYGGIDGSEDLMGYRGFERLD